MKTKLSTDEFIKYIEIKKNSFLLEKNLSRKDKLKRIILSEIDWFIRKVRPDKSFKLWANQILRQINS